MSTFPEGITRRDVEVAEDAARAHLLDVRDPAREGWVCADCDPDDDLMVGDVRWLWRDDDGNGTPLCEWHASERVHDAIPYGSNCSGCGKLHSALWPDGEPLFDDDGPLFPYQYAVSEDIAARMEDI